MKNLKREKNNWLKTQVNRTISHCRELIDINKILSRFVEILNAKMPSNREDNYQYFAKLRVSMDKKCENERS